MSILGLMTASVKAAIMRKHGLSHKKPEPLNGWLMRLLVTIVAILCRASYQVFHQKWIFVIIIILGVLVANIPKIIYLCNKICIQNAMNHIKKECLPRVRIEEVADRIEAEEQHKKEMLSAGGWICAFCGHANSGNIGFCKCGRSRGESKKYLEKQ